MDVRRGIDRRLLVAQGIDRHGEEQSHERIPWRPVPTRIDIELTSTSGNGSWTWRAAAREPKGVLDGSILPGRRGRSVTSCAPSEHDVDGIRILSIVPPKQKVGRSDVLELLPSAEFEPVTQQRTSRDRDPIAPAPQPRRRRRP